MNAPTIKTPTIKTLGLVIRHGPWQGRSNREQLDFALAAAALEVSLQLYFLGEGILQTLAGQSPDAMDGLPSGHKAWAALAEMTEVEAWAEADALAELKDRTGADFLIDLQPASVPEMASRWLQCDRVLVL